MAISLKTAGTWARLVVDGTVTIPGSPAAGDRMFLFAAWKTYTITVTDPTDWTPIGTEFADGVVDAGVNVGSVKVHAWYKDWESGDTDPNIDWSANPTEGHAVIMLWQKGSSEFWSAPTNVTAAIAAATSWTATSSATIFIPNNSVVMELAAFRDDSATMTRSTTTAIEDDGSPNVTWNGNYVESPATHFSSTTGQDMSGDLGHRFVTTGAAGVNLTGTGTLSASETGAVKWIVQGLQPNAFGQAQARIKQTYPVTYAPFISQLNTLGYVAHYRLGESSGSVIDRSATANHGTVDNNNGTVVRDVGGGLGTGQDDGAIGIRDFGLIDIPHNAVLNFGDTFTIGFGYKRSDLADTRIIYTKGETFQSDAIVIYFTSTNILRLALADGSDVAAWIDDVDVPTLSDDNWHFAVVTKTAGADTAKWYFDGVDVTSGTSAAIFANNSDIAHIGGNPGGGGRFNGDLDEFFIANTAYTAPNVLALYNAWLLTVNPPLFVSQLDTLGYVGHYQLGESSGSVIDRSVTANHGTVNNDNGTIVRDVTGGLGNGQDEGAIGIRNFGHVDIAHNAVLNIADTFTIGFGFKRTSNGGNSAAVWSKGSGATDYYVYFSSTEQLRLAPTNTGAAVVYIDSTEPKLTDNAWHFAVVTKSGSTAKWYLDGVDVTQVGTNITFASNSSAGFLGSAPDSTDRFNGDLDEFFISSTAFTAKNVVDLYNSWLTGVQAGPFGQAQADIISGGAKNAFGRAQSTIKQIYRGFGQSQADIKAISNVYGNAQADIKAIGRGFGQAQGSIKQTYRGYGQSQADIKATSNAFGQAQARIKQTYNAFGQAQASIKQAYNGFGQAQARIKQTYPLSPYARTVLNDSPVAYWRLGESSGLIANDEIGSSDGTYTNSPTLGVSGALTGDANTAVTFPDGVAPGSYVIVPSFNVPTSAFSLEAWVKGAFSNGDSGVLGQQTGLGALLYINSVTFVELDISGVQVQYNTSGDASPINNGQWHYLVGTWDGTNARLYLDTVLVAGPTAIGSFTSAGAFIIGNYGNDPPIQGPFDGTIDEPAVYNYALTQTQITRHFNASTLTATGPFGQAQALITGSVNGFGQAQASIKVIGRGFGQAAGLITYGITSSLDTFSRTTENQWGNADIGGPWTMTSDAQSGVDGTTGHFAEGIGKVAGLRQVLHTNSEVVLKIKSDNLSPAFTIRPISNTSNSGAYATGAAVSFNYNITNMQFMVLFLWDNGQAYNFSSLPQSIKQIFPGEYIWIKARTYFTNTEVSISVRLWKDGQTEPAAWQFVKVVSRTADSTPGFPTIGSGGSAFGQNFMNVDYWQSYETYQFGFGQAAARIVTTTPTGQAQALITNKMGFGQAQAKITAFGSSGFGNAQALIINKMGFSQSQARIKQTYRGYGQARAYILPAYTQVLDTFTRVVADNNPIGTADIGGTYANAAATGVSVTGTALRVVDESDFAPILTQTAVRNVVASAKISATETRIGSGGVVLFRIFTQDLGVSINESGSGTTNWDYRIRQPDTSGNGANIYTIAYTVGTVINLKTKVFFNGDSSVSTIYIKSWVEGTTEPHWLGVRTSSLTPEVYLGGNPSLFANPLNAVSATNILTIDDFKVDTVNFQWEIGQAQARIKQTYNSFGQAQAQIKQTYNSFGQAQAKINAFNVRAYGQAQAYITSALNGFGQAQAQIVNDCYSNEVASDIPISYWRLAESSGNILDSLGPNHSTSIGGTPTYGVTGAIAGSDPAITFDGSTEFFTIPDHNTLDLGDGPYTIEFWAKRAANGTTQVIYYKGTQGDIYFEGDNTLVFGNTSQGIVKTSVTTTDTNWHYYVLTRTGSGAGNTKIYKDAINVTTDVTPSATTVSNTTALSIGYYGGLGLYFNGSLDEIALYSRALTPEEIIIHYNARLVMCDTTNVFGQAQASIRVFGQNVYGQAQGAIKVTVNGFGQSQARIKQTYNSFGQAQADIKQTYNSFGNAQGTIKTTYRAYGQAQGSIKQTYSGFGNAQGQIKQTYNSFGQAQTDIKQAYRAYGNAQGTIKQVYNAYGQAQADIKQIYNGFGQAQAKINAFNVRAFGQAQATIEVITLVFGQAQAKINAFGVNSFGQAQGWIEQTYTVFGQAQGNIKQTYNSFGQAQSNIKQVYQAYGQSQAYIKATSNAFGNAQADIKQTYQAYSNAQADIKQTYNGFGQAQGNIKQVYQGYGQAQGWIEQTYNAFGQAQGQIKQTYNSFGQAQGTIKQVYNAYGQSQGKINAFDVRAFGQAQAIVGAISLAYGQAQAKINSFGVNSFGQAQSDIKVTSNGYGQAQACIRGNAFGQAQADIKQIYQVYAQAQANIKQTYQVYAQSQASIKQIYNAFGNAQGSIKQVYNAFGQAQGLIKQTYQEYGQAQGLIKQTSNGYGQAQASIKQVYNAFGQAQADILQTYQGYGNAQANILQTYNGYGNAQGYIVSGVNAFGQAQGTIKATSNAYGQAQGYILGAQIQFGQAQGSIKAITYAFGNAQADIKATSNGYGNAQGLIKATYNSYGQSQGYIVTTAQGYGQSQGSIKAVGRGFGQSQGDIKATSNSYGQAQSDIKQTYQGYGNAQALILVLTQGYGNAQGTVKTTYNGFGQSQGNIKQTYQGYGNAQSDIKATSNVYGQAQGYILTLRQSYGQAQAYISGAAFGFGQAQAVIFYRLAAFGQAQAFIQKSAGYGQAQALIVQSHTLQDLAIDDYILINLILDDYESITLEEQDEILNLSLSDRLGIFLSLSDRESINLHIDESNY
jgi:peptidoglycan hydrolase CwlO-like protein